MLIDKANQMYQQWVDVELKAKDSDNNSKLTQGYLEEISKLGVTISNNQPATGSHETVLVYWEDKTC